ncbi:MAG: AmmeMemoRadiSam system protein B [Rhodocyclaceae bacterium]|jgi:AmmeMemoRadiSam system protein B|nr:AmmeMemoRadiSam system protein B [Rhodocyclaceae bacterium]
MANASVRTPAVAGAFYPADPRVLLSMIGEMLTRAVPLDEAPPPKALIVPHAGYIYSGPVAASAYAGLARLREIVRRVILLGPNHRVALGGMALPASLVFSTPLGEVEVDREHWQRLQQRPDVVVDDHPHAMEHSLEVHLPFLQAVLNHFTLTPLVVGDTPPEQVAALLEEVWGGPETLIVVSSDLSHYQPYHQAQWCDRSTVDQILHLDATLDHQQACGATSVNGLLRAARRHHLEPHLLDLRNSGDTSGDRQRVVGYASVALCEKLPHVHH